MDGHRSARPPAIRVRHGLGSSQRPVTVVHVDGEHDRESCGLLVEALGPLAGHVVVDLARCTFLDTSVIGAIIGKTLELGRDGYRLEVAVPPTSEFLCRTVERLGIRDLLPVRDEPPRVRPDPRGDAPATGHPAR